VELLCTGTVHLHLHLCLAVASFMWIVPASRALHNNPPGWAGGSRVAGLPRPAQPWSASREGSHSTFRALLVKVGHVKRSETRRPDACGLVAALTLRAPSQPPHAGTGAPMLGRAAPCTRRLRSGGGRQQQRRGPCPCPQPHICGAREGVNGCKHCGFYLAKL